MAEFSEWPKTPRLFRDITITEKIDGTNGSIIIEDVPEGTPPTKLVLSILVRGDLPGELHVYAQSRKRLITPQDDNAGFAKWVADNSESLARDLGPGRHYGEWWGSGIQRKYGMTRKAFSLFNTAKWDGVEFETETLKVVPTLYKGGFESSVVDFSLGMLAAHGSYAASDFGIEFDDPEGVIVYHQAANSVFKVTLDDDGKPKSVV